MNIAYLILAHTQPLQLKRLIDRLNQTNVYFFIHIDKKTRDVGSFDVVLSSYNNVTVISTRNVNWMGYTTIEAELDLCEIAYNHGMDFKYYVLMSGQDYPIKSNAYIYSFFATHSEDFMSYTNLNYVSEAMRNKLRQYHFRDIPYINPRSPKKVPFLLYLYFGLHRYVMKVLPKRNFYKGLEPYFGSQWFAFTHETIGVILNFVKNNKGYLKSMKYTDGPDEVFFHTIIMNSERRTNVIDYNRYIEFVKTMKDNDVFVPEHASLRYMDWSEKGKPKPAILGLEDFDKLEESKYLFARKVDEKVSLELLNKIDKLLLFIDQSK